MQHKPKIPNGCFGSLPAVESITRRTAAYGQKQPFDSGEFTASLVAHYIAVPASKLFIVAKELDQEIEDNALLFLMDVRASVCDLCLP